MRISSENDRGLSMAAACSRVHTESIALAASEDRIVGMLEGCRETVLQTRASVAWARMLVVELKTTRRIQEPLGGQVSKLEARLWMGVSAGELRGKIPDVWLVSFQDMWDSSEGRDFGQEELSVERIEYEVPLDFRVLEPRGEHRLEMDARVASGTRRAQGGGFEATQGVSDIKE